MSWFILDAETDGDAAGLYSMVSFGAIRFDEKLDRTFYAEVRPISPLWVPERLAVSRITREQHEQFEDPALVMPRFRQWVLETTVGEPKFWSDNPAFDASFFNYYFSAFCGYGTNPFGHSARRIGDLFAGLEGNARAGSRWRNWAETKHTHHPVDDARGHAEALRVMVKKYNVKGVDWSVPSTDES